MPRYIGTKVVEAQPQTQHMEDGYEVVYADGYTSWSPKEVFEASYNQVDHMNFGDCLYYMKIGASVRLPFWGEDVRLTMQFPDKHSKMTHPYIYVKSRNGLVPWTATQIELIREDWELIVEPDKVV